MKTTTMDLFSLASLFSPAMIADSTTPAFPSTPKIAETAEEIPGSSKVRTRQRVENHHILILNAKGGSGKTTLATNLASYLASVNRKTALLDFDPQASSSYWLNLRKENKAPSIYSIQAYKKSEPGITRSQQLSVPADVSMLIYDTPGSLDGMELDLLIERAQTIIIPVQPSPIDIHAATRFIQKVLLNPQYRKSGKRIAVVANRARSNTVVYGKLRLFLNRLSIPLITTIRDSQNYVKAFESGLGICDLPKTSTKKDRETWVALVEWIDQNSRQAPKSMDENNAQDN